MPAVRITLPHFGFLGDDFAELGGSSEMCRRLAFARLICNEPEQPKPRSIAHKYFTHKDRLMW